MDFVRRSYGDFLYSIKLFSGQLVSSLDCGFLRIRGKFEAAGIRGTGNKIISNKWNNFFKITFRKV